MRSFLTGTAFQAAHGQLGQDTQCDELGQHNQPFDWQASSVRVPIR